MQSRVESMTRTGVVVIGRNEGERLRLCLTSVLRCTPAVVYVDSGSTDGSPALAGAMGVAVVDLDMTIPFTAARARNTGSTRLLQLYPELSYIQFVDGDCELAEGWMAAAQHALEFSPDLAVVCGRRRERFPQASVYNQLCDLEWNTPVGEATACGGDAMMRLGPLQEVGGYRESLIAGEEPELCCRLRQRGWRICRIDAEMTLHDAAMTRFSQWWKRAVRAGHAFAECSSLHSAGKIRLWKRETRSIWLWGGLLPVAVLASAAISLASPAISLPLCLVLLLGYVALGLRIYRGRRRVGYSRRDAHLYARFCVLAKFPQMIGVIRYHWNRLRRRRGSLIEYK
jgi:GT2 family glycosyltransferase